MPPQGFPLGSAICLRGDHFQRVQQLQRHSEAAAPVLPGWVKRRFQHLRKQQQGAFNRARLLQNIAFITFSLSCPCLPSLSAGEQVALDDLRRRHFGFCTAAYHTSFGRDQLE